MSNKNVPCNGLSLNIHLFIAVKIFVNHFQSANILDILGNGPSSPVDIVPEKKSGGATDLLDLLGDLDPVPVINNTGTMCSTVKAIEVIQNFNNNLQ